MFFFFFQNNVRFCLLLVLNYLPLLPLFIECAAAAFIVFSGLTSNVELGKYALFGIIQPLISLFFLYISERQGACSKGAV
jgi:hypothetical protein